MSKLSEVLGINNKRVQELQHLYTILSKKTKNASSMIVEIESIKLPEREKIYLGYILGRNVGCYIEEKK